MAMRGYSQGVPGNVCSCEVPNKTHQCMFQRHRCPEQPSTEPRDPLARTQISGRHSLRNVDRAIERTIELAKPKNINLFNC